MLFDFLPLLWWLFYGAKNAWDPINFTPNSSFSGCSIFYPLNIISSLIMYRYWILSIWSTLIASIPCFLTSKSWILILSCSIISCNSRSYVPTSLGVISISPSKPLGRYGISHCYSNSSFTCSLSSSLPSPFSSLSSFSSPCSFVFYSAMTSKLFLWAFLPPLFHCCCLLLGLPSEWV